MNDRFSKAKVYASLISLGCCGGAIFVLPYLRYVFYDLQIGVSGMNNAQSAFLMTIYTLVSTVLAVPCGMLIDRIPSKTSVIIALLGTVGIAVFYAFTFFLKIRLRSSRMLMAIINTITMASVI